MFSCRICQENKYLGFEEYCYQCTDCKNIYRICSDCNLTSFCSNSLPILKHNLSRIFKNLVDIKLYIIKIVYTKNLPSDIGKIIFKYVPFNYQFYSSFQDKIIFFNKYSNELQYINTCGLQIRSDTNLNEFYSKPLFTCESCLEKYKCYDLTIHKLI